MADENQDAEVEGGNPDAVEFEATLVHGQVYYLGNRVFENGKPLLVTNAEKASLEDEEHAGDVLTNESGGERDTHIRLKFRFDPVGSNAGVKRERTVIAADAPPPPRRVRQAGK